MCVLTILIKIATLKRKSCYMTFAFACYHVMFYDCLSSTLQYCSTDWKKTFLYLFFNWCSRGMWTVPEMLHWTIRRKLGYRLYYFVRVDITYREYSRKIAKARKQGCKITLDIWPNSRCLCSWNEIGLKVRIVYEVRFKFLLIFVTVFI